MPALTLLLIVVVGLDTFLIFSSQKKDSHLINLAGRQRMLLQRYYREATKASPEPLVKSAILKDLLQTARTLRYGGHVNLPNSQEVLFIPEPNADPKIQAHLDQQISDVESFLGLQQFIEGDEHAKRLESAIEAAGETVLLFVEANQAHVRNSALFMFSMTGILGLFGLFLSRLIFERRKQLQLLTIARDEAVRASHAKTQFLANMSHEIRTPLNAIIGMTDVLQGTELNREQSRFVSTLRRAGDTLLALINDILDLSKVESGQLEITAREFDLFNMVDRLGEMMALRAHQKRLELTCYIAPEVSSFLVGDETRLRQVLINLLGNAIKFTSAGEINLRIDLDSNSETNSSHESLMLRCSVSDTGIGIPEDRFNAIFENFSQADSSISVNFGGTGLGLAISKQLVELMGGRIWVRSQVGMGSTFTFTVPVKASSNKEPQALPVFNFAGKRVLVVDDNDTNRLIVHKYLEEAQVRIDEARSGTEGLELIRKARAKKQSYDVILLDFRMPGLNGVDVAEQIRRELLAEGAIIMLLTSDGKRNDVSRLSEIGISEFMIKPIRKREFLEAIARNMLPQKDSTASARANLDVTFSPDGKGKRILVVDDVEDNRFLIKAYLEGTGFFVEEASDGQEAFEKYQDNRFDLIFMDMRMAPMDGYSATRKIRQHEENQKIKPIPIVALTAHAMKHEVEQALSSGCDRHITKPISRQKLFETLHYYFAETGSLSTIEPKLEGVLQKRFPLYLENLKQNLSDAESWLADKNTESLIKFGHNISGTAGMYGMEELGTIASHLEQAAKLQNWVEISDLKTKMNQFVSRIRVQ